MGDIKLFQIKSKTVTELRGTEIAIEKSLQNLIEKNMEILLGVTFLSSEYSTGKTHGGRIDSLGIDENGCPVIVEYKRAMNENVINQGLFYLDWLMDHKAQFKILVMDQINRKTADNIEWSSPRLLCIAGDFTKYDLHAVQQINRNLELIRYKKFGKDLILFELVNATMAKEAEPGTRKSSKGKHRYKYMPEVIRELSGETMDRFDNLKSFILALGDDVQMKQLKFYVAFKRIKNFACVEVHPQKNCLTVFLKIDPKSIKLEKGFTRDVSKIGHYGTGDLEVTIKSDEDIEKVKKLISTSYEES